MRYIAQVLDLAILGVLMESELHGYELRKRLYDVLGWRATVSFGSLYPALNRLEREGYVKAVESSSTTVADIPMTGSFSGEVAAFRAGRRGTVRGPRNKKVYGITPEGERRLGALIADPADDERTFALKLAFCRHCNPQTRIDLLVRRRDELARRLAEPRANMSGHAGGNRYVRALRDHDTETIAADIAWLDGLLVDETAPTDETEPRPDGGTKGQDR